MRDFNRRGFLALTAVLGLAGCAGERADESNASKGVFPATVSHVYGETTVKSVPQRVACIGLASHDVCLLLGVVPIAINVFEVAGSRYSPWFYDQLVELGGSFPETIPADETSLLVNRLKGLAPDLILAVNSGITRAQYEKLSLIAPVVAYKDQRWNTPWRDTVRMVATALGKAEQVDLIVSEVEESIAEARAPYPRSVSTAAYLEMMGGTGADVRLFGTESNEVRSLRELGLESSAAQISLEENEGLQVTGSDLIPLEDARNFDVDIVFAAVDPTARAELIESGSLSESLGRTNDNTIVIPRSKDAFALQESSPLSLLWVAQSLIPEIARVQYLSRA